MQWLDPLSSSLRDRSRELNAQPLANEGAQFVLVWLQQTLRGHEHPTIEVALAIANALGLPVLVYHGLRPDYPHASERLSRFIVGASAEMGRTLAKRGIACRQLVQRDRDHGRGMVYRLAEKAACIVVDDHPVFVARAQSDSVAKKVSRLVIAVDATRLVPHSQLDGKLGTTKAFRAAHTKLREDWKHGYGNQVPAVGWSDVSLPTELKELAQYSDEELDKTIAALPIGALPYALEHPATRETVEARMAKIDEEFVRSYKYERNNPSKVNGATELSPYLHFGMVAPWEIVRRIEASEAPKSYSYKLRDELLTWREWTHWRLTERPELMTWESLPTHAKATLLEHADDPRDPALRIEDVMTGQTPDDVFNAAARCWLVTGWLHNNLRMYWAKQIIRFIDDPRRAWAAACYINDKISYDGRDPATYSSMRWAFGEARPGYREIPIYGKVMPKSSSAILKRAGMSQWIESWATAPVPTVNCDDFQTLAPMYGVDL